MKQRFCKERFPCFGRVSPKSPPQALGIVVFDLISVPFAPADAVAVHGDQAPAPEGTGQNLSVEVLFDFRALGTQGQDVCKVPPPQGQGVGRFQPVLF